MVSTTAHALFVEHYSDVIMGATVSQITGVTSVYSNVCSGAVQRKHQSSPSLATVRGLHRRPVNYPHKGQVTRKIFPFNDVIMFFLIVCFFPFCCLICNQSILCVEFTPRTLHINENSPVGYCDSSMGVQQGMLLWPLIWAECPMIALHWSPGPDNRLATDALMAGHPQGRWGALHWKTYSPWQCYCCCN